MPPPDRRRPRWRRPTLALLAVAAVGSLAMGCGPDPVEVEPVSRGPVPADAQRLGSTSTTAPVPKPWFGPYVDVTLPPLHRFGDPAENVASDVVLGFVVAAPGSPCVPTWGGHATLDEAATRFEVDTRIAELRSHGGDVVVSFGGAAGRELALDCVDAGQLTAAYRSVIDRYAVTTIDLDVEGPALRDHGANRRRAAAMKTLQDEAHAAGEALAVWLTVPVLPEGMPSEATAWIDEVLAAGVDLTGVNLMTMNFSPHRDPGHDMVSASDTAAQSAHRQLDDAFRSAGTPLPSEQVWAKVGLTPMIGQNDLLPDRLRVEDASRFAALVTHHGMGRLSMWSLNRDRACDPEAEPGADPGADTAAHHGCSGEPQEKLAFSRAFAVFEGRAAPARTFSDWMRARLAAQARGRDRPAG